MSKLTEEEDLIVDLIGQLAGQDIDAAVELVTGVFAGLMRAYMEFNDQDPDTEIVISGDGEYRRKITLHRKGEE